MSLDVEVPNPPTLGNRPNPDEYDDVTVVVDANYRRSELAEFLEEGAWQAAFKEWAARTQMTEDEFDIVQDLGLLNEFDFFWDDFANRVGYHSPGIPEDWRERNVHPAINSWETVSSINAGLTELGQVVCDVLKTDYIDWEATFEAPDDLPDFS